MERTVMMRLQENQHRVERAAGSYVFREPLRMIEQRCQFLDELEMRMSNVSNYALDRSSASLERLSTALNTLNPLRVLERGYAFVTDSEKKVISTSALSDGTKLQLHFADGSVPVTVEK